LPTHAIEADGEPLQPAHQHGNGDDQKQPIDALGVAQAAAPQLEET